MKYLLLLALSLLSCNAPLAAKESSKVSVEESGELITKKVQLLDVRTKEEWDEGHLEGAVLIDVTADGFDEKVKKQLDSKKPLLVYCRSGMRSAAAYKKLKGLGFETLYDMKGGILAWQKAGNKVVK